ncbi:uncharacterized protein LOC107611275 [Arachis ipaensis]|uniref:uncharacterized protein LOC107611275 n=1 Tax=Arachis ipaensis TaxID=130454 RepID=UPI0007AF3BDB|nr:uncharacterized protein LOC107611275 [Arachis ipaensis]
MTEVPRGVKNPKVITKFAGEVEESTTEHVARYLVEIENLANDENLKMKFFPSSLTKNAFTWFSNLRPNSIMTWNQSRCYVSLPENEIVKIAIMGLGFYMRRKLLNVHIPDMAHLAEKVCQTELMKKEKEKYRSEQRSKSKPFTRKEKVAYVTMESSEEELDFETEVNLAELKKGLPYLILPEGRTLLSVKDFKEKPYCKFHQATSHLTNSCVRFRDLIQEAIMEGGLKFDDGKEEMKVDVDPFDVDASFVEPCFGVNMVGMSYDFDVALDDFESQVRTVYPRAGDSLLDFLVQQKIKDRDVSLCPRCNTVF